MDYRRQTALTLLIVFLLYPNFVQAKDFCSVVAQHVPAADVDYKPGAEDVVPADIGGATIVKPIVDPIVIPVQIQLQQTEGLNPALEVDPVVAALEIYQDGRVLYNDQDISAKTSAFCSQAHVNFPKHDLVQEAIPENRLKPLDEDVISGHYPPLPEAIEIKRIEIIPVDP